MEGVELVLVTHTHPDHFDAFASSALDKNVKLFCQPTDEAFFSDQGFKNAEAIHNEVIWNGIRILRTGGQHGRGKVLDLMGQVSGFILTADGQPTIYIVGDSVYTDDISDNISKYKPDYIVVNSGGAVMPGFEQTPILMDENETISLLRESADAVVIAVHLEAIDHCKTTRESLRSKIAEKNIPLNRLHIPDDGDFVNLDVHC